MMRNLVFVILTFLISSVAFAGQITKVKGTNALIDLQGGSANVGDLYYANSADGKHRGILQITKIKGDKAIAHISKGKAEQGMAVEPKGAASAGGGSRAKKSHAANSDTSSGRSYWGVMAGYAMDKMSVQVNDSITGNPRETAALSGSSFSGKAMFDYELFPQIWFRGLGGLEGFNVAGPSVCGNGNKEACNAKIYYMAFDFVGRYVFSNGNFRPWIGGGISLMFPATKSATALAPASISNTSVMMVAAGGDWFISPNMYIPLSIEYGLLPKSNEVDATWIEFRFGLAIPF